jgi:hemerythrin-like domain-containing protein
MDRLHQVKDTVVEMATEARDFVKGVAGRVVERVTGQEQRGAKGDVLELLKQDHQNVAGYFAQLEATDKSETQLREGLFAQLKYELETHAAVEEKLFYPKLQKIAGDRPLIAEALAEHAVVKQLLGKLALLPMADKEWMMLLKLLKQKVEHHVDEEENKIFPAARAEFSEEQLKEWGRRLEAEKEAMDDAGQRPSTKGHRTPAKRPSRSRSSHLDAAAARHPH